MTVKLAVKNDTVLETMLESIETSRCIEQPYRHWALEHCLPPNAVRQVLELPFATQSLDGVSGKRDLHNATRKYFDRGNREKFPICEALCGAFQSRRLTQRIAGHFGTKLNGTYLRVEYAQDSDGFWLEPHTDLGVKTFTMLLYLSKEAQHRTLGTDIYDGDKTHVGRFPFASNTAMVFVPSSKTFHGFERRKIEGLRKSLIINYVTSEWRARDELAFPDMPIAG